MSNRRAAAGSAPPRWVLALAAVAVAFFTLPLAGLVARAPWSQAWTATSSATALTALRLSLTCSFAATLLSALLGIPLAWVLARVDFPGRSTARALCTLSMVLPPVVGGVALLFALGRRGLIGVYLDRWFDVRLPFTTAAVVLAQLFVAMPFLVVTVEAALRQRDRSDEEAAATLGAGSWMIFRRVTLPSIRPALVAGLVLAWARALGEFGATVTFAGSFPGVTRTLPLAIYSALETDPGTSIVYSLLMVAISFAVLIGLRDRWWTPRTGNEQR